MIEIINRNISVLEISDIKETDFVGFISNNEKFIVVNRRMANNDLVYNTMNATLYVSSNNYAHIKTLLELNKFFKAFKFDTKKEMFNWLLIQ